MTAACCYRLWCALFNYRPRQSDELELHKGDIISLVDVAADGWFIGTSQRTKQFGAFPGNYVRPITEPPSDRDVQLYMPFTY